jgi:hypothetical protein
LRGKACAGQSVCAAGCLHGSKACNSPDGVMRRIHADNVFRKPQHALAELALRHDCAQITHGLAVLLRVRDGREWVQPAIVLRERLQVRPRFVVMVEFRHSLRVAGQSSDRPESAEDCA